MEGLLPESRHKKREDRMKGKTDRGNCRERCEFEDIFNGGAGGIYWWGSNESGGGRRHGEIGGNLNSVT